MTVVSTVMRPARSPANHESVNDSARVHLALELTGTPEHIEGTLHRGGLPALSFSGWSELFAALQTVACEASPPVRHSSSEARTDG